MKNFTSTEQRIYQNSDEKQKGFIRYSTTLRVCSIVVPSSIQINLIYSNVLFNVIKLFLIQCENLKLQEKSFETWWDYEAVNFFSHTLKY